MARRIILLLIAILVIAGIWLWYGTQELRSKEEEVARSFNEVLTYYVGMRPQYVLPLLSIPALPAQDTAILETTASTLKTLGDASSLEGKYSSLLKAQQAVFDCATESSLSELVASDPRYIEWSVNATSRGHASQLLYDYNQALARYRGNIKTTAGRIAQRWYNWPFLEYLNVDGKTTGQTTISF